MNYIWCVMIILGIVYGSITGNIADVGNGALDSARDAVSLCITMLGVMSVWTGIMEIADKSGIIAAMSDKMAPVIKWLFPGVPRDNPAFEHITMNLIANILGLGWAATPAGLKAMKALSELNRHSERASNDMCTFLIINISSLQLIPVSIIAYRSQYGSVNPSAVIGPGLFATIISTLAAIIFCKVMCSITKEN